MSRHVFVTTDGSEIKIKPIAIRSIDEIRITARKQAIAKGEAIEPPCYEAHTATGDIERHPHDATTLQTDEDKAAWAEHQAALARLDNVENMRIGRYIYHKGLVGCTPPEGWAAEQAGYGIEISADPGEAYDQYIELEILKTQADIQGAILAVMRLSAEGQSPERLALLDEMFRRALEGDSPVADTAPAGGVDV